MPRVPRTGHVPTVERQVLTEALPGARLTAAPTETSLGVGVEQAKLRKAQQQAAAIAMFGETLGRVGGVVFEIAQKEQQRADEIAYLDAENQLDLATNRILHDPQTGALNKHGKDALSVPEDGVAAFEAQAEAVAGSLHTDNQRKAFAALRLKRLAQLDLALRQHTASEIERYEAKELQSTIANATQNAIANATNPDRVRDELARAGRAVRVHGPRLGLGPEQIEQQLDAIGTEVHAGVIEGLVTADRMQEARSYFNETKDEIKGEKLAQVTKLLEAGELRKTSQIEADKIIAAGGTLQEQRQKAKAIDDAQTRDAVLERVEHEFNVRDRIARDEQEARVTNGKNIIDQTGDWQAIPLADWQRFTVGEAAALKAYAEHRVTQREIKTNPTRYHDLVVMATSTNRKTRDAFLRQNLVEYVTELSPADLKHFIDLQGKLRAGDEKAALDLITDDKVQADLVDEALVSMGFDPTPAVPTGKDKAADKKAQFAHERVADFRRAVRDAARRVEQEKGRPPTDAEVQSIVDRLRIPTVKRVIEDGWFSDTKVQAYAFETAQARATSVDQVPARERRKIEEALRAEKLPINDASVLAYFNQKLAETRKDR